MAILARAEVDLRHPLQADGAQDVDQHRDLDAVADRERDRFEHGALGGDLARQRLPEPGELREVEVQVRAGQQFRHAAAAVGLDGVARAERAPEVALDERDLRLGEQRAEQAEHEALVEVLGVGVEVDDELAGGGRQPAPHRVALAERRSMLRQQRRLVLHAHPALTGDHRGPVARAGVDDQQLVDQLAERLERVEDRPERARDLAGGEDHRDGPVLDARAAASSEKLLS